MSDGPHGAIRLIDGFGPLAVGYDLLLCDVWGVIHNGVAAFRPACEALVAARRQGLAVVLVSNAPRPSADVVPQLRRLGVPDEAWDRLVTSGDVARAQVEQRRGEPFWLVGPERDLPLIDGLQAERVELDAAGFILCTGLFDDETEVPDDYRTRLASAAQRGLPMICANPDLVVERGHRLIPCAGSLAQLYETLGGRTLYCGKPHAPIYDLALATAADLRGAPAALARICAIGDAIRTDVAGAVDYGLDVVLVLDGIHANETVRLSGFEAARLEAWLTAQTHRPTAAMARLAW